MTSRETAIATLLTVVIAVMFVLGFLLLPFDAAGTLECEGPLKGADPKAQATEGFLVGREEEACSRRAGSRVTTAAISGALYLMVGLAAALAPQSRIERALFGDEDVTELYDDE